MFSPHAWRVLALKSFGQQHSKEQRMSLLDQLAGQVLGSLAGANGQPDGQQQGGGSGALIQVLLGLLQSQGGLGGLLGRLSQGGLGEQVSSWVGTGQNLPVSAEQIGKVFGGAELSDMAAQLGIPGEQLAGHIANLLPGVVDGLTPNGQLPDTGAEGVDVGQALAGLAAMFGKG